MNAIVINSHGLEYNQRSAMFTERLSADLVEQYDRPISRIDLVGKIIKFHINKVLYINFLRICHLYLITIIFTKFCFPIFMGEHGFVICVDARTGNIAIIDSLNDPNTECDMQKYNDVPDELVSLLVCCKSYIVYNI